MSDMIAKMSQRGLTALESTGSVKETIDRLAAAVSAKGITVFARIDHGKGAVDAGLALRPTELLVFGNAKGGTPLMQACQVAGIDLPLKMLSWQDESGQVWLAYNDPAWIAQRHGITSDAAPALAALGHLLADLAKTAAG